MWRFLPIPVLLGLSILLSLPLFQGKIPEGHDTLYAFVKTVSMYQSWSYGDFIGRWTPDILQGYGYPAFNYYAPLFFSITAALSMLTQNVIWGFNLGLFLTFFASACAIYLYAKEIWGSEGGFLSAVAYLFAPYHIVELYVRGSCGELTAFIFIPLALFALHRLSRTPQTCFYLLAVFALAGLMLSHNLTALFTFPILYVYTLILIIQKRFSFRWILLYHSIFVLALGLSAYFWVPAIFEQKYVRIDHILQNYDYRQHFLYWDQLLFSKWGSGGSGPGRADGMSFQIGPVHLALTALVLINFQRLIRKNTPTRMASIFWIIMAVITTLLTLHLSAAVWKVIPILHLSSLPWRFLLIVTFSISFIVGGISILFKKHRLLICLGAACLIIFANISYCRAFGYQNLAVDDTKSFLQSSTPHDVMEYLPHQVKKLRLIPSEYKIEAAQGKGRVLSYHSSNGLHHTYTYSAQTPVVLLFHSFYFPEWKVYVNGQSVPILSDNPFGLIAFTLPKGNHDIELIFANTRLRSIVEILSAMVFLILILTFLLRKKIDSFLRKNEHESSIPYS